MFYSSSINNSSLVWRLGQAVGPWAQYRNVFSSRGPFVLPPTCMLRARGGRDGGTAGPWAGSYSVTILYMRAAHPRGSPGTAPGAYNLLQCRPAYCAWSGMVCKGKAVLWAGVVCLHVTKASRSTCPAFLVQVRTSAHRRGGAASHGFRCSVGKRPFAPLFSAAEKVDTEQQVRH